MGQTKKPCEGCGETPEWMRTAGEVCADCKRLMEDGRKYREMAKRKGVVHRYMEHQHYAMPMIHHSTRRGDERADDSFTKAFYDLVFLIAGPGRRDLHCSKPLVSMPARRESGQINITLSTKVAGCLDTLYGSANQMVQNAHENGHDEGQRLLLGLADGSLSIDKFNRATMGEQEE